jgi:hypothetical protein
VGGDAADNSAGAHGRPGEPKLIRRQAAMAVSFLSCTKFQRKRPRFCMSLAYQGG